MFNIIRNNATWAEINSKCKKLKVGCVLSTQDSMHDRVSNNRPHHGTSEEENCETHGCILIGGKCVRNVHAEQAVLMDALVHGRNTIGGMLTVTHTPCIQCSILIIEAGIKSIYIRDRYKEKPITYQWFSNAGIKVFNWKDELIKW